MDDNLVSKSLEVVSPPKVENPFTPIDLDLDPETVEILLDDRISTGG